jgi:hypothetical protein
MKSRCTIAFLLLSAIACSALDRHAFTFTSYTLNLRIEPEQQRLGAYGRITLRNDSYTPQKTAALQISSSLSWRAIQSGGKALQFVMQPYESDIDHTGELSEAIVTLPKEVPPNGSIDLDIRYEGIIPLDTTRLTRIGTPKDIAAHTDWDQISPAFTAVRGVGYVVWYPVSMDAASLSDGDSVFETIAGWKVRERGAQMMLSVVSTAEGKLYASGTASLAVIAPAEEIKSAASTDITDLSQSVPTFVAANFLEQKEGDWASIAYTTGYETEAKSYVQALSKADRFVSEMVKPRPLKILQLPDASAASFAAEGLLLTPLLPNLTPSVESLLIYAAARTSIITQQLWLREGLSHFAQVRWVEQQKGRQAAIDYLNAHLPALLEIEKQAQTSATDANKTLPQPDRSLTSDMDDIYLQTKSMFVFWLLKEMLGDQVIKSLMFDRFQVGQDKNSQYLQQLLQVTGRDLSWFFDDWVYHDRGLPDFKVASVYTSKTNAGYLLTVTVENLGAAGAEVPVTVHTESGPIGKRLEVRGKSKASIRIETTSAPDEVVVNDGSVPESDMSNNSYAISPAAVK